jgi:hypothetical protein
VCSEGEVQITKTDFSVLPVSVTIPVLVTQNEQCKVTFSAEVATAEATSQLLVLGYAFSFPPPPGLCQSLDGPVLTKVEGGIDETHTFISTFHNSFSVHGPETLTPCISSAFGGPVQTQKELCDCGMPNQVIARQQ